MVLRISIVLCLALVFPFTFSMSFDDFDESAEEVETDLYIGGRKIKLNEYLNLVNLEKLIDKLEAENRQNVLKIKIGETENDTPIWGVEISQNVRLKNDLKPRFKFTGGIHADEAVGYALMTSLMQYLVHGYNAADDRVTKLLKTTRVWIIPTMNPDGFNRELGKRGCSNESTRHAHNGNGRFVDLDWDFMDTLSDIKEYESNKRFRFHRFVDRLQRETRLMVDNIIEIPFVLGANLQGGHMVAYYFLRYDIKGEAQNHEVFESISRIYANQNTEMKSGTACPGENFTDGITNQIPGKLNLKSMQYANYLHSNCLELTLYLSCCRFPPEDELPHYWNSNLNSMLSLIESTRQGIYGLITNAVTGDPVIVSVSTIAGPGFIKEASAVTVSLKGLDKVIKASEEGKYWKLLLPGTYDVIFSSLFFYPEVKTVTIDAENPYVQVDVELRPNKGIYVEVKDKNYVSMFAEVLLRAPDGTFLRVYRTDTNGVLIISDLEFGEYNLTASRFGYITKSKSAEVTEQRLFDMTTFYLAREKAPEPKSSWWPF